MLTKTALLATVAFAYLAAAVPQPAVVARQDDGDDMGPVTGEEDIIDLSTYPHIEGAVALAANISAATLTTAPTPTAAAVLEARAGHLTIKVVNKFGKDIYTKHARNAGAPAPVSGNVGSGVLKNGATAAFAVPTGWAGNVALVQNGGGRKIVGDESLIEASFVKQGGSKAVIDIDVSYVTGFSVPVVCSCDNHGVVTGCNTNLWGKNTCPNDNKVGSCRNPMRGVDTDNAQPSAFFKPCQHKAFTVPRDPGANANGICTGGTVTCCVGTSGCPAHK